MERLADWLIARRHWVFGVVLLISTALGIAALRLSLDFRSADLLPQGHPFIEVQNRYHKNFGETNVLTVMLESREGTIFTAPVLATLFRLTEAVDRLPGVNHDQVSSLDQRAAGIRAGFHEQHLDYRRLFEEVNAKILPMADEHAAVYVTGLPRLNGWILRLEGQVLAAFAIAILVTWLCLYAYFRDWRGALRPTISGGLAALWGFGLMHLAGFALNPLTLVIPFLITARAVSHSAQMHDRYYEELGRGAAKAGAIRGSFGGLFAPTTAGILTDALGVLAIGIIAIPALRQLAVTATLWLLSLMVTELCLNPIVYTYLRAPEPEAIRAREQALLARWSGRLASAVTGSRGRWATLGAGAIVLAVALVLLSRVQVGDPTSASRVLTADSEYNRSHRAVQEEFGGSEPFLVVAEGDGPGALQRAGVLRTIEQFQRYLERTPMVGASFSLVDILTSMGERFHELEPKWGVIPTDERSIREMFFTYWGSVYPSSSARFFTPDFRTAHVTFFCHDHTIEHVRALVSAAREFIAAHPLEHVQFRLAGGFIGVMAAVYDEILRSQALMTAASFLVIFVVCAVTYRSLVAAVLLILPLALANAVVNAYMAARGIGLDLDTLPVIAVGVGFGIDYGIYILSRIQEGLRDGVALDEAVRDAIHLSGRTVAFTALSMTAGVLCFTPTALRFVGEMATLLALWMVASSATALTLLPALILITRPGFLARSGAG